MKTYGEQFDEAIACKTKEDADRWMNAEIARYHSLPDFHGTDAEAREIILVNLGYIAGYYNREMSQKIFDLFGAKHPIFGEP